MRIAILGATSQIARDLITSLSASLNNDLHLFARRPSEVSRWLAISGLSGRYLVDDFSGFSSHKFDAIINFVGVGSPARAVMMGSNILDVTLHFDEMVLQYLKSHPMCRYLFLSSGAAYGSDFIEPAKLSTPAIIRINNLVPQDWYGMAKLYAESRHRAHPEFTIFDIRVFNYFSRTQDINARFLITDMLCAIRDKLVMKTTADYIVRDYLHPSDFHRLISALLATPAANAAVDCYSLASIDKLTLLSKMQEHFGLQYELVNASEEVNATGKKTNYFSLNKKAADFGYEPLLTSLEGILMETTAIFP